MKMNEQNKTEQTIALETTCGELRELLAKGHAADANARWTVGARVNDLRGDEDKYGKGSVDRAAKLIGCTAANLYAYALVAKTWDITTFKKLLARKNSSGLRLTFSHFVELAAVDDNASRETMFERALEGGWSVLQLKKQIPRKRAAFPRITRFAAAVKAIVEQTKATIDHLSQLTGDDDASRDDIEDAAIKSRELGELVEKLTNQLARRIDPGSVSAEAA